MRQIQKWKFQTQLLMLEIYINRGKSTTIPQFNEEVISRFFIDNGVIIFYVVLLLRRQNIIVSYLHITKIDHRILCI